jgi:carbonic anhydrase/acetyltransferase-like protein (isoleucine patch superfamily)
MNNCKCDCAEPHNKSRLRRWAIQEAMNQEEKPEVSDNKTSTNADNAAPHHPLSGVAACVAGAKNAKVLRSMLSSISSPPHETKYTLLRDEPHVHTFGDAKITLYPIQSVRTFENNGFVVHEGDKGGLVEGLHNLSQSGTSWIDEDSVVINHAFVRDDAFVGDHSFMLDSAVACDNAKIINHSTIYGNARVTEYAATNHSEIGDCAYLGGSCEAVRSTIIERARVEGFSYIHGSTIHDDALILNCRSINYSNIGDHTFVNGKETQIQYAGLGSRAYIEKNNHYLVLGPLLECKSFITFFRNAAYKHNNCIDYVIAVHIPGMQLAGKTVLLDEKDAYLNEYRLSNAERQQLKAAADFAKTVIKTYGRLVELNTKDSLT